MQLLNGAGGLRFNRETNYLSITDLILGMASRRFTLPVALSMLEIPLPEEEEMIDDEFDGYIDADNIPDDDNEAGDEDATPTFSKVLLTHAQLHQQ